MVTTVAGGGLEGEGVGAGGRFGQAVGAQFLLGQLGEVLFLEEVAAPVLEGVDDQGVLNVDHDPHAGIDPRQGLDDEDGREEVGAQAPVFLGDFDAHVGVFETGSDQLGVHLLGLIHLHADGLDPFLGKLADGVVEELFFFTQNGQWHGTILSFQCSGRHLGGAACAMPGRRPVDTRIDLVYSSGSPVRIASVSGSFHSPGRWYPPGWSRFRHAGTGRVIWCWNR